MDIDHTETSDYCAFKSDIIYVVLRREVKDPGKYRRMLRLTTADGKLKGELNMISLHHITQYGFIL